MTRNAIQLFAIAALACAVLPHDASAEEKFKYSWDMQLSVALYEVCITKVMDQEISSTDPKSWAAADEAETTNRYWEVVSRKCDNYLGDVVGKAKEQYGSELRRFLDGIYYSARGLVMGRVFGAVEAAENTAQQPRPFRRRVKRGSE